MYVVSYVLDGRKSKHLRTDSPCRRWLADLAGAFESLSTYPNRSAVLLGRGLIVDESLFLGRLCFIKFP